ncbi:MAG: phosphatidylserine decarboxylase [Acidobacteriaceae bacterium]|nr:phosphatidylserine decarboxylase [Acidobacteriaceae bacterium]MBV9307591.1 phosphatidylserine decarboxylase [Acidobacteriaceae bacterium]
MRIVSDGIYYAAALAVIGGAFSYFGYWWIGTFFYVLAAFCLYFFRDPERTPSPDEVIFSPADGKVVSVRQISPGETRISIFLNIFNVHVNRAPISGKITEVLYRKGRFLVASHEAASVENEQNTLVIDGKRGRVVCRQIAGLIARRIVCYKQTGDSVLAGERIGYIKFGSRVDVLFGPEWKAAVNVGDRVSAGTTVLANPSSPERTV